MDGTSSPLAARSVAMSTSARRWRKHSRTRMRSSWSRSPCSTAAARWSSSAKLLASSSTPCFDLEKTRTWPFASMPPTRSASQGHLSCSLASTSTVWATFSATCPSLPIVMRTGCCRRSLLRRSIFGGKVAEKSSVWREGRTFCTTERIWGSNPMCSMRSASSSTRKVHRCRLQPFIFTMSIMRPGVAMAISLPAFRALNCWCFESPPARVMLLKPTVLLNLKVSFSI
mmetsp:Transcript_37341/g.118828  ORF Transcript_37341/g.118828 Transcript_37341/m.118828 type:complete len:228 (-) Transcript_37341:796-1479(-)